MYWQNRLTELLLLQVDGDVEAISKKQRFPQQEVSVMLGGEFHNYNYKNQLQIKIDNTKSRINRKQLSCKMNYKIDPSITQESFEKSYM